MQAHWPQKADGGETEKAVGFATGAEKAGTCSRSDWQVATWQKAGVGGISKSEKTQSIQESMPLPRIQVGEGTVK